MSHSQISRSITHVDLHTGRGHTPLGHSSSVFAPKRGSRRGTTPKEGEAWKDGDAIEGEGRNGGESARANVEGDKYGKLESSEAKYEVQSVAFWSRDVTFALTADFEPTVLCCYPFSSQYWFGC
jgi:hypothetical protein